jgi:hypothetical protein
MDCKRALFCAFLILFFVLSLSRWLMQEPNKRAQTTAKRCAELQVRGVRRARRVMRGGLVVGAGAALHGARMVCDAMRCARAGCIRSARCAARDAMQCAARGLVAVASAGGAMLLTEGFLGWVFFGIG